MIKTPKVEASTEMKETEVKGLLTNYQILLVQKQLQRIVACEGGEFEKGWDTVTLVLKMVGGIPFDCWCPDCMKKLANVNDLIQRLMVLNGKSREKPIAKFSLKVLVPTNG